MARLGRWVAVCGLLAVGLAAGPPARAGVSPDMVLAERLCAPSDVVPASTILSACETLLAGGRSDADILATKGAALRALHRYPEAREAFDQALALAPSADLWVARAMTWGPTELRQRLADLDKAASLSPDLPEIWPLRVQALILLKDFPAAQGQIDARLAKAPDDPDAIFWRAQLREGQGQYPAAVADFTLLVDRFPRNPPVLNERCWVRAIWGRELDQALADCNAALALDPDNPGYLDSRALVYLRNGQIDLAIADYDLALADRPDSPTSLYGRGLARLRKGQTAEGRADLAAAAALMPEIAALFAGWGLKP